VSVRGTLGGVVASVAVLVVGWQIGAAALGHGTTSTTGTASGSSGTGTGTGTSGTGTSGSTSSGSSTASTLKDGTYTGKSVQTRYGDIQVAVTVSGGRITDVTVPQYPQGNPRDAEINAYALPVLVQETLDAQSADIQTVSGATVTSDGYIESLQAALDAAHL